MSGRHGAQPASAGVREASPRASPPRRDLDRGGPDRSVGDSVDVGVRGTLPVPSHGPGRDEFRDRSRRCGSNIGFCPGGGWPAGRTLRSILFSNLRATVLALAFLGAITGGAGLLAQVPGRQAGKPDLQERQAGKPDLREVAARAEDLNPHPAPGRMFITGRVLDPQGTPVPNATTMVYAGLKQPLRSDRLELMAPAAIGEAMSDASGRFRLDAARTSSSTHEKSTMIATAPDLRTRYSRIDLNLDADFRPPTADITLRPKPNEW